MQRDNYAFFEKCNRVPAIYLNELDITYAEYMPWERIFSKNPRTRIAKVEPFQWK